MFLSRVISLLGILSILLLVSAQDANVPSHATVLILGGGMTGIIAARTLHEKGIDDFIILEARSELGGRLMPKIFGVEGTQVLVEVGANWVQGTQTDDGPANPIWELARKWKINTTNDLPRSITTYDDSGYNNYIDVLDKSAEQFTKAIGVAGQRLKQGEVDLSLRSAYGMMGFNPITPQEVVSDYYHIDYPPSQTSWLAAAWNNNFTYNPDVGGFSNVNAMCTDQRGFRYIVQSEADQFLQPNQLVLSQTVDLIVYNTNGVTVHTNSGLTITADHVLCTFSVGVLQNKDIKFQPPLPNWKIEAINSIEMTTYTKIFLQFNQSFWFPTQMGLYADKERGRYPVWQNLDLVGWFPGSNIIFVTVTGDYARYVEQLTFDEVQSEVVNVLQIMYPDITVPQPAAIYFPTWTQDPLFRGSYSNWGPSFVPAYSENLRATLNNRVWFAGEATSLRYFGFLQGAYFEGLDAGSALAACINGIGPCERPNVTIVENAQSYPTILTSPIPAA